MAEVIRERVVDRPVEREYVRPSSGLGVGTIIALILLLTFLYLLFVYGLPFIKSAAAPTTNIKVPDRIDVNVNNQAQPGQ